MMNISLPDKISIVLRSYNEAWALDDTLNGVFNQNYEGSIELIAIDSGSTDGSIEIINKYNPAELYQLKPGEYIPGVVLNRGIRRATSEWVVFLNSDATPANRDWLPELLKKAMATENLGAAFSRQIPRTGCKAIFAHDYDRCFGPQRESASWDHFFSMVSCVTQKSVWEKHPIREDLQYAEDDEWTRRLKAEGYEIAFAEKSLAIHSHNYTLKQSYRRARGDMLAVTQAGSEPPASMTLYRTVFKSGIKDALRDWHWCRKEGRQKEWLYAVATRIAQRLGRWSGNNAVKAPSKEKNRSLNTQ